MIHVTLHRSQDRETKPWLARKEWTFWVASRSLEWSAWRQYRLKPISNLLIPTFQRVNNHPRLILGSLWQLEIWMAPEVGLEPTTLRLTATESAYFPTATDCYKSLSVIHLDLPSLSRIAIDLDQLWSILKERRHKNGHSAWALTTQQTVIANWDRTNDLFHAIFKRVRKPLILKISLLFPGWSLLLPR